MPVHEAKQTIKSEGVLCVATVILWLSLTYMENGNIMHDSPDCKVHGPTWGPSGADKTQVGPMFAHWTLLSGSVHSSLIKLHMDKIKSLQIKTE